MTLERANTGTTNDDRTDIACWIGRDLIPNLGDALTAAERLLASKWLAETIAGAKAQAWEDGAVAATGDAKRILRGEGEPGNAGESISLNYADELLDDMAAQYREQSNS